MKHLLTLLAGMLLAWAYEPEGKTSLVSLWGIVSGSLRSNVTDAVWAIIPLPGEPTKFFRIIKRD